MFPIPWNFPFRKKDGSLVKINDVLSGGGGGYTLPTASAETKGGIKIGAGLTMDGEVLNNTNPTPTTPYELPKASAQTLGGVKIGSGINIDSNGVISASGGGGGVSLYDYGVYAYILGIPRPMIKPTSTSHKYSVGSSSKPMSSDAPSPSWKTGLYDIDDAYLSDVFNLYEYYNYLTAEFISDIGAESLCEELATQVDSIVLSDDIANYEALIIQGCYNSTGASEYDTTIIYENPRTNFDYWFGVKDRNGDYCGFVNFTDGTHGTLSVSRRVKVYGIPK